jgi:hypothetical protein
MDEIRDSSVESKLDSEAAQILGDFSLVFVAQIIALQLVDLIELGLRVPFVGRLKERHFLKDTSHFSDVSDMYGGFLLVSIAFQAKYSCNYSALPCKRRVTAR